MEGTVHSATSTYLTLGLRLQVLPPPHAAPARPAAGLPVGNRPGDWRRHSDARLLRCGGAGGGWLLVGGCVQGEGGGGRAGCALSFSLREPARGVRMHCGHCQLGPTLLLSGATGSSARCRRSARGGEGTPRAEWASCVQGISRIMVRALERGCDTASPRARCEGRMTIGGGVWLRARG